MSARAVFLDPFSAQFVELEVKDRLVAHSRDEIRPLLDELTKVSSTSSQWAVGYVTYEAAPALDSALCTHDGSRPFASFLLGTPTPVALESGGLSGQSASQIIRFPEYQQALKSILEHIHAGDIYQANYTMPLELPNPEDAFALWKSWVARQETSHAVYLEDGDRTILGVSPELFFQIENREIVCRPMKGTRPRGRWSEEDADLRRDLSDSEKDRAENLMILDMIRNDLGRIAEIGSVQVSDLFNVQQLPTVFQMTSTVRAKCEFDLFAIFRALFPCASVTGAPKIMATQVIRDLEPLPRDVYCGAVGVVAPDQRASFNVPIRTGVLTREGLHYWVGSGIVADSDPELEWAECQAKAKVATLSKFISRQEIELIETMRSGPGGIERWEIHKERLAKSAAYYGLNFDPEFTPPITPVNCLIRITLSKAGLRVEVRDLPESRVLVRLKMAKEPVNPSDRSLYHKTACRDIYVAAKRDAGDANEAVLFNLQGEVTETDISSLAIKRGEQWITPALDCGLLPGVMRRVLLEEGKIVEGRISVEEFVRATEIAVFNSVRGWRTAFLD